MKGKRPAKARKQSKGGIFDASKYRSWNTLSGSSAMKWEEEGQIVEGFYRGTEATKVGKRPATIHKVEGNEGMIRIWDSKVLSGLKDLEDGTPVRIEYLGKVAKGKRSYHNFKVEAATL